MNCYPCPAGYFCVSEGQTEICPAGYYCPEGTGLDLMSCPRGTYSDQLGLYEVAQCKPCPAGMYCDDQHLSSPAGNSTKKVVLLKFKPICSSRLVKILKVLILCIFLNLKNYFCNIVLFTVSYITSTFLK